MGINFQPDAIDETSRWVFFVGAPRSGTTSLAKYLRGHPQACLSRPKEPHFFAMRDLRGHSVDELRRVVRHDYLDRFFPHRHGSSVLAEGSVSYLYAPERLEPVLRIWPRAKFVICLRNPLQMVPSLHQRHFVNGDETVREFARAWELVAERRNGRRIPRSCLDPRFLDYWEAGRLGRHVEKFLSVIGRERCHISIFDDLKADPKSEYRRMLQFVELPDDGKDVFERHAESRDCRMPWLQRLLQRPPKFALGLLDSDDLHNPRFAETAGPVMRKILDLRTAILDWNEVPAERRTVDTAVIDQMRGMYAQDVALLSKLVGRDLGHWLQPEQAVIASADGQQKEEELAFQR
jgi:sulfotransferase family protein